jgi:hypothetical protein
MSPLDGRRSHSLARTGSVHWSRTACLATVLLWASACGSPPPLTICKSDWDNPRLLLDCFAAEEFPLSLMEDASGKAPVPARFTWTAPARSDLVVCALFVDVPQFDAQGMSNFGASVAYYGTRLVADGPSQGTFNLETARRQSSATCPWKVAGVGCWAYSLTRVVGATALSEVGLAGLDTTCASGACAASERRLGAMEADACLPFCTTDLSPHCDSCSDGLCHGLNSGPVDGGGG